MRNIRYNEVNRKDEVNRERITSGKNIRKKVAAAVAGLAALLLVETNCATAKEEPVFTSLDEVNEVLSFEGKFEQPDSKSKICYKDCPQRLTDEQYEQLKKIFGEPAKPDKEKPDKEKTVAKKDDENKEKEEKGPSEDLSFVDCDCTKELTEDQSYIVLHCTCGEPPQQGEKKADEKNKK
jgi:hypothetical protein